MATTIYALLDPRHEICLSNIRYVGLTRQQLRLRLTQHISYARGIDNKYRSKWIRKLLREGVRPVIYPLTTTDLDNGGLEEKAWIARLRALGCQLTNLTNGGEQYRPRRLRGQTECSIEDCHRPVHGWGWCALHYKRWQAKGDPLNHDGKWRTRKTQCLRGHPYDEDNTGYDKRGRRYCKQCRRISSLARYHANKVSPT